MSEEPTQTRSVLTDEEFADILAQMVDGPPVSPTTGTFRREEMYE
jgi:hypothetical protein